MRASLHGILLAAAQLCQRAAAQGGTADLAIVRSAQGLAAALEDGRAHIELQSHLDLDAELMIEDSIEENDDDYYPVFLVSAGTRSIRVRLNCCTACHERTAWRQHATGHAGSPCSAESRGLHARSFAAPLAPGAG